MTTTLTAPSATLDYGYYGGLLSIGSELQEADRENYTEGDCYLLAKELHLLGLGELVIVAREGSEATSPPLRSWTHMAVRTPEGYILDADGLNEPGITLQNYGDTYGNRAAIQPIDLEDYAGLTSDQAESIFEGDYTRGIALELQAWLAKVPPLKPLSN